MTDSDLRDFARRYTEAWCSGDPARVADAPKLVMAPANDANRTGLSRATTVSR